MKIIWKGQTCSIKRREFKQIVSSLRKRFDRFTLEDDIDGINRLILKLEEFERRVWLQEKQQTYRRTNND
jgi:hypothetical protein